MSGAASHILPVGQSFRRAARLACACGLLAGTTAFAQTEGRTIYLPMQKDVAMLVDVSKSVQADTIGHNDASQIIKDIVGGRGFRSNGGYRRTWEIDSTGKSELADQFAVFLGQPGRPDSVELRPLGRTGGSFLSLPMGRLATVLNNGRTQPIRQASPGVLEQLVDSNYPETRDMIDQSTCYWFAMASAADTLSQQSKDGYYLFVVSDEEDDPDYLAEGPRLHSVSDYLVYKNGRKGATPLSATWPESTIRSMILRFFTPAGAVNKSEKYTARTEGFGQKLIARFVQRGARGDAGKVCLSWYAMGTGVTKITEQIIPNVPAATPPPLAYRGPDIKPRLKLLGGLEHASKTKVYDYERPLVVWQMTGGELAGWTQSPKSPGSLNGRSIGFNDLLTESARKSTRTLQVLNPKTGSQDLTVEVKGTLASGQELSQQVRTQIASQPRTDFWLMVLAITSLVAAVGIFFFAWRNLRETRMVAAS